MKRGVVDHDINHLFVGCLEQAGKPTDSHRVLSDSDHVAAVWSKPDEKPARRQFHERLGDSAGSLGRGFRSKECKFTKTALESGRVDEFGELKVIHEEQIGQGSMRAAGGRLCRRQFARLGFSAGGKARA